MQITEIPFNKLLGMKPGTAASGRLLQIDESPLLANHLGTVHASVQLALAEASSAEFLLQQFPGFAAKFFGVVRRIQAKFISPLTGRISSTASMGDKHSQRLLRMLGTQGRGLVVVEVEILDDSATIGMSSSIEWFIQRHGGELKAEPWTPATDPSLN
jgi:hypothetical protein